MSGSQFIVLLKFKLAKVIPYIQCVIANSGTWANESKLKYSFNITGNPPFE